MRARVAGLAAILTLSASLATSANAVASVQLGNACTTTNLVGQTVVSHTSVGPLPSEAPSDGVITKWRPTLPGMAMPVPQKLKVLTPQAGPNQYKVDADSAIEQVPAGATTFDTRLPIQTGDRIGLWGPGGVTMACGSQPGGSIIGIGPAGETAVGATATFPPAAGAALPVVVTIEGDADGDGFGDETQDLCPQAAAVQVACPTIAMELDSTLAKRLLKLRVSSNAAAEVTVSGTAKIAKPKGGKGKRTKQTVNLSGGTQNVLPGTVATFKVKYPKALTRALKKLPASRSIKLKLNASAPNVIGDPTLAKETAKAPGKGP